VAQPAVNVALANGVKLAQVFNVNDGRGHRGSCKWLVPGG
jgi:hypothetical protein